MRHLIGFSGIAIVVVSSIAASARAALFRDNFEAGTVGAAPGPAQDGAWNTAAGEYGLISTAQAYDGTKSLFISRVAQTNPRAFGNIFPYITPGQKVYARFR